MMRKLASAVLLVLSLAVQAGAQEVGNWRIDTKSPEYVYAASVNDSGGLLGEYCFIRDNNCAWLLGMSTACDQGASYPVLANADSGAIQLQVYCDGQLDNGLFRYVFTEFALIDDTVKKSSRIGFAIPLQSDQFKVIRFQTKGAVPALTIMRGAAERRSGPGNSGTKDQEL